GKGASFIFDIQAETVPPAVTRESSAGPGVPDDYDFTGMKVLIAEDIEINREIVTALLEPTGITIDLAEDGREAYEHFAANPAAYNMILMDIHMPKIDGYETTKMIRSLDHPWAKMVPIIAMTADVFREDIEKCLAAGMNDHVGKPLDMERVIEKIVQYGRLGN
ncbi:MAG: response regulator, partial [Treponema sp.]|nr:response regulator [Treponema sp.]